jgi:DNA-binding response OmpR family regulator
MNKNKKKILIIEDERTLLMALKSKLEKEGYNIVFAEDGEEGEKLIKKETPDLILLDILLPKKDGFQILEDLNKEKNKTPVIIISNSGQPVEIDRALKLGVKDYLVKADFSPEDVLEKVRKILGNGLPDESQAKESKEPSVYSSDANNASNNGNGPTVLIIEDDEFLREVIAQKLLKEGFDVQKVIDANRASESIKEKRPKLILLDLILPGMDGFELLDHLKKTPSTRDIPVVVLSNLGQKEDKERAMTAGAVDYLIKADHTPADIVQRVREVLNQKYL